MRNDLKFSDLLHEWYSLNAKLIQDISLPNDIRFQLLQSRQTFVNLFITMDGTHYDRC